MGRNRKIRARIEGLSRIIKEHEEGIKTERAKAHPNRERIAAWEQELAAWEDQVVRLNRRLERKW